MDKTITKSSRSRKETPITEVSTSTPSITEFPISQTSKNMIRKLLLYSRDQENEERLEGLTDDTCCPVSLFGEIDRNNDGSVSFDEFQSWVSSIPLTDEENGSSLSTEAIFEEIDTDNSGYLSLEEFQLWTKGCLLDGEEVEKDDCSIESAITTLLPEFNYSCTLDDIPTTPKTIKYRNRFKHMIKVFADWGSPIPVSTSSNSNQKNENDNNNNIEMMVFPSSMDERIRAVVDGCFVGAKNPGVVKSLGILYEDYLPLRLAGDVVFKLVESSMSKNK